MNGGTMSDKGGGLAFPRPAGCGTEEGMTLRDYFAAHALAGISANPDISQAATKVLNPRETREAYAVSAYAQADAMLKAREER